MGLEQKIPKLAAFLNSHRPIKFVYDAIYNIIGIVSMLVVVITMYTAVIKPAIGRSLYDILVYRPAGTAGYHRALDYGLVLITMLVAMIVYRDLIAGLLYGFAMVAMHELLGFVLAVCYWNNQTWLQWWNVTSTLDFGYSAAIIFFFVMLRPKYKIFSYGMILWLGFNISWFMLGYPISTNLWQNTFAVNINEEFSWILIAIPFLVSMFLKLYYDYKKSKAVKTVHSLLAVETPKSATVNR